MIYVLYATKVNIGGWATFTRHLMSSLHAAGEEAVLVKIGNRDEAFLRPFGPDHDYQNVSFETLKQFAKNNPIIIAALGKHYVEEAEELIKLGAKVVVHDTAESTNRMDVEQPWVIRKALAPLFADSVFIRHPYVRHSLPEKLPKRGKTIYATSRVDFDKNTAMILDANRMGADIKIVGFENRLYTKFKIVPDYPEWVQSPGTHPRTGGGSFELLLGATAMVDLTDIKGDGGGTQYTFLEAWDAGAVPIIGSWWSRKADDMVPGENCYTIDDAAQLAKLAKALRRPAMAGDRAHIARKGEKRLQKHSPKIIVPQVKEWLGI